MRNGKNKVQCLKSNRYQPGPCSPTPQACLLVNLYACILLLLAYYERKRMTWMDSIDWTNVRQLPGELKWFYAVYFVITVVGVQCG